MSALDRYARELGFSVGLAIVHSLRRGTPPGPASTPHRVTISQAQGWRGSHAERARQVVAHSDPGERWTPHELAEVLGIGRTPAAVILARFERAGWLRRVHRGVYVVPR